MARGHGRRSRTKIEQPGRSLIREVVARLGFTRVGCDRVRARHGWKTLPPTALIDQSNLVRARRDQVELVIPVTIGGLKQFVGIEAELKHAYSDDSKEIKYAVEKMGGLHDHSQQYRSETNGMIERCVQKINEGTAAVRGQSGLAEAW